MIVDSSAVVAIIRDEPAAKACLQALLNSPTNRMSAATFLEAAIVIDRLPDPRGSERFDELISELGITIETVTFDQAQIARDAHGRFGRGSDHLARLNYGDCFAYALAKDFDESLLFVGNDFIHTDIRPALT